MIISDFDYSSFNIKTAVHVGANVGEELQFYKDLGVSKLYYFEPREEALVELMDNCKTYRKQMDIIIFPIGLGANKDEKQIYSGGQSSSFLPPKIHLNVYPGIHFNEGKTLSVRRGDQILPDNLEIDLLNLDVQGYELEVLKGLGNLLNKTKIIYTEINTVELYEKCSTVEYLDAYLFSFKFKRVRTSLQVSEWGDAIYIKQ